MSQSFRQANSFYRVPAQHFTKKIYAAVGVRNFLKILFRSILAVHTTFFKLLPRVLSRLREKIWPSLFSRITNELAYSLKLVVLVLALKEGLPFL